MNEKKYVMIVTSEDERYGREVQLDFFTDKPWEGLLEDIVFGDNWNELFFEHEKDNEGLFYQLYATDTGKRIGYGTLDPDSPAEEIEEYEFQRDKEAVENKTWNVEFVRSGSFPVEARTETEAWMIANELNVGDVHWSNSDWSPTSVRAKVNKSEF